MIFDLETILFGIGTVFFSGMISEYGKDFKRYIDKMFTKLVLKCKEKK